MKKLIIISVPNCDAFFDQDGIYIKSVHDGDGYFCDDFSGLLDHFGIEVERKFLSKELSHRIDVGMHADKELSDFILDIKKEIKG